MLRSRITRSAAVGATAVAGVAAFAADFDPTGRAGRVFDAVPSVVVVGPGSPLPVRRWAPFVFDDASSAQNNAAVQIVRGRILGAASSFSSTGNPRLLYSFGTADQLDAAGGFSSNDVLNAESLNHSNTVGDIMGDGTVVYRANFAGAAVGLPIPQNNIEVLRAIPNAQSTPVDVGLEVLTGPGITAALAGSAFLGTPGALGTTNRLAIGVTCFSASAVPDVPVGCNIWDFNTAGGPLAVGAPNFTYSQAGAELLTGIAAGAGRQTQPKLVGVGTTPYVIFGIGDNAAGGSARPQMMVVDAYLDNDAYTGAVTILPPAGYRFVDHQATGGGSGPFQNARFSMNSRGQLAIVVESIATPPDYQLLRYDPQLDVLGRIIGFAAPALIADADTVGGGVVADNLIVGNNGMIPPTFFLPFSGVSINNLGNIGFTASYDAGGTLRTAAYLYHNASGTLHQLTRELDVITFGPLSLTMNIFPQNASDSYFGPSLARTANVMAMPFRDDPAVVGDFRGILVLAIGHIGDANFDGNVGESDLGILLSAWQAMIGDPAYDPQADFNCDGVINEADLGALLANWNP